MPDEVKASPAPKVGDGERRFRLAHASRVRSWADVPILPSPKEPDLRHAAGVTSWSNIPIAERLAQKSAPKK